MVVAARRRSWRKEERPKGLCAVLAACCDGESVAAKDTREGREKKERKCEGPSTDFFARSASLHNAPRLHPTRVTAVSLSLSLLSICFFSFHVAVVPRDVSRIRIEHLSCNVIGIFLDSVLALCSYNDANEKYFI